MNTQNYTVRYNANAFVYLKKPSHSELGITLAFYVLLMLTIMIGNGSVLMAFVVNKYLRTATNTLIMGLAVSDILVGFVSIPCWLYIFTSSYDEVSYQFYITFDIFIGSASILQLTALSMERWHAIARPLRHRTLPMSGFYTMIAVPWLTAAVMASLQPVQFERWKEVYTLLMAMTCFFLPLIIIFIAYLSICFLARSKRRKKLLRRLTERKSLNNELRLSITLALITGLFVMAWLPLFVVTVIGTYYPHSLSPTLGTIRLLQFVKFCHYSNSALNPFVYACRSREMICTLRYIGNRLLCKGQQQPLMLRTPSFRSSFVKTSFLQRNSFNNSLKGAMVDKQEQRPLRGKARACGNCEEKHKTTVFMYSTV